MKFGELEKARRLLDFHFKEVNSRFKAVGLDEVTRRHADNMELKAQPVAPKPAAAS